MPNTATERTAVQLIDRAIDPHTQSRLVIRDPERVPKMNISGGDDDSVHVYLNHVRTHLVFQHLESRAEFI